MANPATQSELVEFDASAPFTPAEPVWNLIQPHLTKLRRTLEHWALTATPELPLEDQLVLIRLFVQTSHLLAETSILVDLPEPHRGMVIEKLRGELSKKGDTSLAGCDATSQPGQDDQLGAPKFLDLSPAGMTPPTRPGGRPSWSGGHA